MECGVYAMYLDDDHPDTLYSNFIIAGVGYEQQAYWIDEDGGISKSCNPISWFEEEPHKPLLIGKTFHDVFLTGERTINGRT